MRRILSELLILLALLDIFGKVIYATDLSDESADTAEVDDQLSASGDEFPKVEPAIDLDKYEEEPEYDDVEKKRHDCKKGSYYKPDPCNICYCLDDDGHTMCTLVKCTKKHKLSYGKESRQIYKKLSSAAINCVPPEIVIDGNCQCTCKLPSVIVCPETCFKERNLYG